MILKTVPNTLQHPNHFAGRSNTPSCKWTLPSSPNDTWPTNDVVHPTKTTPYKGTDQPDSHHYQQYTTKGGPWTDIITWNSSTSEGECTIHLSQSNIEKCHLQNQTGTPTGNKIKHINAHHHGRSWTYHHSHSGNQKSTNNNILPTYTKTNKPCCHANTSFATIKQWAGHQQQTQFSKANLKKMPSETIWCTNHMLQATSTNAKDKSQHRNYTTTQSTRHVITHQLSSFPT